MRPQGACQEEALSWGRSPNGSKPEAGVGYAEGSFLLGRVSWLRSSRRPSPREAPRGVAAQVSKALVCRRAWWGTGNLGKSCPVLVLCKASRVKPHGSVLGAKGVSLQ